MKRTLIIAATIALAAAAQAETPEWFETDSAAAIANRTRADFPWTVDEFADHAMRLDSTLTRAAIDEMILNNYVETMTFDGQVRVFRKAMRNLYLLDPARNGGWHHRGCDADAAGVSYVDSVIDWSRGLNPTGGAHRVRYSFTVAVPYHEALSGDTLRVWMPVPFNSARQSDFRMLATSQPDYVLSDGRSLHNTIYFEAPAPAAPADTARFSYEAEFTTTGQYFTEDYILANLKPYDTASDLYRQYTATEAPHIIELPVLARAIVGNETNPYRISEKVFDFIVNYPWAGAREYSTLDCIPTYVLHEGHGDCGQVSLLYISLMRTLGIPARWESGWMLHPGEKNFHDWAEVYFEGVGWVPVDVSFGRYTPAATAQAAGFYSHGMDSHRFASNHGIAGNLFPPKRFVRSETIDFQAGEVETSRGNLYWPGWSSRLNLISVTPIEHQP